MLNTLNDALNNIDNFIWGMPLIVLILFTGILLTVRLRGLQVRHLGKALHYVFHNEDDGEGEVTSFGALCTALSATIGTGNIVGCATAIVAGGPGALFWMYLLNCYFCRYSVRNSTSFFISSSVPMVLH